MDNAKTVIAVLLFVCASAIGGDHLANGKGVPANETYPEPGPSGTTPVNVDGSTGRFLWERLSVPPRKETSTETESKYSKAQGNITCQLTHTRRLSGKNKEKRNYTCTIQIGDNGECVPVK